MNTLMVRDEEVKEEQARDSETGRRESGGQRKS
jgi:hypothetical protein